MSTILGIETSCDETAAAVVADATDVRGQAVATQFDLHQRFGGVVPEVASRAHVQQLDLVVDEAMKRANCTPNDLDAIAVTNRPGLLGALLIGLTGAKALSWAWGKPLVTVDHIRAHAFSPAIGATPPPWPAVALVVSGGHTSLFRVDDPLNIHELGATIDDAAGEAFDKVSTMLGLGFPGGPRVEQAARAGDPCAVAFPRSMLGPDSLDFSFSGIKTAVLYCIHGPGRTSGGLEAMSSQRVADIAAGFQQAVVEVLVKKTLRAVECTGLRTVVLGGGVAANAQLRDSLAQACSRRSLRFVAAARQYCTDNGAMIAALGDHLLRAGEVADLSVDALATGRSR